MKIKLTFSLYFLLLINVQAQNKSEFIIKDINLLPMTNLDIINNKSVLIQNGKIVQIDDFKNLPKIRKIKVIQGKGKYLMPGLTEMHSHLPVESKVDTLLIENIAAGVTRLRIMNTKTPQLQLKERLKHSPNTITPKLYYSHIITRDVKYNEIQFDSLMAEIKKNDINFIKLFSIANETVFDNLMASANKNNVIVCGHYPSGIKIDKVLNSGFKSIEHLAGYDKIKDENELNNAIKLTQERKVFNCPTLDWDLMAYDLQYPNEYKNRLTYSNLPTKYLKKWETQYSQAIEKAGLEKVLLNKEKYLPTFAYKQEIVRKLHKNNCLLLLGSDPGNSFQMNGFNMFEEMYNWSKAGIDNLTILKSATITPAIFFNEDRIWGTIEIGKSADLIVLEKNPLEDIKNITTVEMTIKEGEIYLKKELLNKL
ncbi:amidohydrolase family protein [Flavobacterium lipolyticum]|uniref:Amidohydrolase family protein n=1 Tax=Flavobacterium lipolyticum TaxID=2893754 RepID=A0ABS8M5I9_9FLAO|nr:amidohydrolase family protein [Flavobacterium sp. F-126]MCC9019493.1 amidohydrolase family protein [Flavobacterium sp. F-126]